MDSLLRFRRRDPSLRLGSHIARARQSRLDRGMRPILLTRQLTFLDGVEEDRTCCGDVGGEFDVGHVVYWWGEYSRSDEPQFCVSFVGLRIMRTALGGARGGYFFWDESLCFPFFAVGEDVLVDVGADKPA